MTERKGLERYKIIEKLGEGGMGEVYLAEDLNLARKVALKKSIESKNSELLKIAEKEAQTLAKLKHQNLPTVYDYFIEDDVQYIVMEYISGKNIDEIMKNNPEYFSVEKNSELLKSLLNILEYLHGHDPTIVHRDIKPQNIKISEDGNLYLLDFGLVKNTNVKSGNGTTLTLASRFFGYSPNYSSLEQRSGEPTYIKTDIYSVCATLYFINSKNIPIDSLDRATILSKGMPDPLQDICVINPNLPTRVAEMIIEGLTLHKENRPATIAELREILIGGFTRKPDINEEIYSNESSRFNVNVTEEQQSSLNEKPNDDSHQIFVKPKRSKFNLAYLIPIIILICATSFYGYENWCYTQNKNIVEKLERSAIDDFEAIEKCWDKYEESLVRTSYFEWGIDDVENKIQRKIFDYADEIISSYRESGGRVKKDEELWERPQDLLKKILVTAVNKKEIEAKIAYLKGQKDFAYAFPKGKKANHTLLDSAKNHFTEAISLDPDFGDPYFMMAQTNIYGKSRNYTKALENIDLAVNKGFPFDTRTKAVKADCLQAVADATAKNEEAKWKNKNIEDEEEAHELIEGVEQSLKSVRDKYVEARGLYEEIKGFGTVNKSLKAINIRLEKLDESISTIDKLHLLVDVITSAKNESEY